MYVLEVQDDIASAHFLRNYEGPCKHLHGHTWKIKVSIISEELDNIGMVVDFRVIKQKLKEFLNHLDHVCLNELDYFKEVNPTTENLAQYIYRHFKKEIEPLTLKSVTVWESDYSSIEYYE